MSASVEELAGVVPGGVLAVCRRLREAGHEAWAVGGAVRDALMGRAAKDWDVATSAHPQRVQALFTRTIPTGLQHGTVTVLVGQGGERMSIEVTTFRGEGAYSDGRRPDEVRFGVTLDEDLARRDFTVNAMAYDPIACALHDPFGGRADLTAGLLRAVGDAADRFREDGLRVMRAARFVATLEVALDPATEAAIAAGLPSLAKVSRERVRDELLKLLGAPRPSRGLAVAERAGILATVAPELDAGGAGWGAAVARVDAAPADPLVRLAALLWERPSAVAKALLGRLRLSNDESARVARLLAELPRRGEVFTTDGALRRLLGRVGAQGVADLAALWGAPDVRARAEAIVARGDALSARDLAVDGAAIMEHLGIPPSKRVGEVLAKLLERVLDDPSLNRRDTLLALAGQL